MKTRWNYDHRQSLWDRSPSVISINQLSRTTELKQISYGTLNSTSDQNPTSSPPTPSKSFAESPEVPQRKIWTL
ncbi:unnamed protein product [Gordionus sp. m RMFG-2023]